jgi:hypothetical protein
MSIDLSDIVWLRRTLARGALGVKLASLNVAVQVAAFIDGFSQAAVASTNPLVVLAACAVTVWAGFRFAGALQRGNRRAAWTALALSLPYLGIFVQTFDWYNGLFKLVTGIPLVFIVLAGLARVSPRSERAITVAHARQIDPFRSAASAGRARPAFGKKLSFGLYGFLSLLVLAMILPPLSAIGDSSKRAQLQAGADEASFGEAFGSDLGRKLSGLFWTSSAPDANPERETGALFGTLLPALLIASFLYRRARRHAMMRATDLARRKGDDAVIVYLRSFADDRLKMRARAANGRWWLESVLRVSFEEVLVDHLWRVAAVIAIGQPGEKLAPLGAAREWVSGDAWQPAVERIVTQARLVVLVLGRTEGVAWEFAKLKQLGCLHKLVLLVPPVKSAEVQARWAALALPTTVDVHRARAIVFPDGVSPHILTAHDRDDWSFEAALDCAAQFTLAPGDEPHQRDVPPGKVALASRG